MTGRPAAATGCAPCMAATGMLTAAAQQYEPGRYVTAIHAAHIPGLQAEGWTAWPDGMYADGTPDIVCPHIAPDVEQ